MMRTINVEFCMGHKSDKLQKAYYKPNEKDVLEDYLKASNLLTINEENRLKRKVEELKSKQEEIALMKLKHENDMELLRKETDDKIQKLFKKIEFARLS